MKSNKLILGIILAFAIVYKAFAIAWLPLALTSALHGSIVFGVLFNLFTVPTTKADGTPIVIYIQGGASQPFDTPDVATSSPTSTSFTGSIATLPNNLSDYNTAPSNITGLNSYPYPTDASGFKTALYNKAVAQYGANTVAGWDLPGLWNYDCLNSTYPAANPAYGLCNQYGTVQAFARNTTTGSMTVPIGVKGYGASAIVIYVYTDPSETITTSANACPPNNSLTPDGICMPTSGLSDGICREFIKSDGTYSHNPFDPDCISPNIEEVPGSATDPARVNVKQPDGSVGSVTNNKPNQADPGAGTAGVSSPIPGGGSKETVCKKDASGKCIEQTGNTKDTPPAPPGNPGNGGTGTTIQKVDPVGGCGGPMQPKCAIDTKTDGEITIGDDVTNDLSSGNDTFFGSVLSFKAFNYTPASISCSDAFSVTNTSTTVGLSNGGQLTMDYDPTHVCSLIQPWETTIQQTMNAIWYILGILLIIRMTV